MTFEIIRFRKTYRLYVNGEYRQTFSRKIDVCRHIIFHFGEESLPRPLYQHYRRLSTS